MCKKRARFHFGAKSRKRKTPQKEVCCFLILKVDSKFLQFFFFLRNTPKQILRFSKFYFTGGGEGEEGGRERRDGFVSESSFTERLYPIFIILHNNQEVK